MGISPDLTCLGIGCDGRVLLARSESAHLRGLTELVGGVFRVPVAYAAMLGHADRVMTRIGSGEEYWSFLKTFPLGKALTAPVVVRDARHQLPEGADLGNLLFAATVPMKTLCGQHLGVLVIADRRARPDFSECDLKLLVGLGRVVADEIEMRNIAVQLMESQRLYAETENRFQYLAHSAADMIACCAADGSFEFVNDAWVKFTGRQALNELGDGWQEIIDDRCRESVLELYWQALQARQVFTLEAPLRRFDGIVRRVRGNATPRFFNDGSFAGLIFCLRDEAQAAEPRRETG